MLYELECSECNISFASASSLLQHFAQHANSQPIDDEAPQSTNFNRKVDVPDLYPISTYKSKLKNNINENLPPIADEDELKMEALDLKLCTIKTNQIENEDDKETIRTAAKLISNFESRSCLRKYKCTYCLKAFGWSTDLKRHILTHTGERPFKCQYCDSTFTRKFLLQKHQSKQHNLEYVGETNASDAYNIPPLKPIKLYKQKSRKQDKEKIKRKVLNAKNASHTIIDQTKISENVLCSTYFCDEASVREIDFVSRCASFSCHQVQ